VAVTRRVIRGTVADVPTSTDVTEVRAFLEENKVKVPDPPDPPAATDPKR
jgi:hypothetical protein